MSQVETLIEELEDIETQCALEGDEQVESTALRARWNTAKDELAKASDDDIDAETRAVLQRRLVEAGVEVLALMYREGNAADALLFPASLLDLTRATDLREEILGAELDQKNFVRLCRARRDVFDEPRESRATLKKIIKETEQKGLKNAAMAALDLPRPVTSAPPLWTFNTLGFGLYGSRDRIGNTVVKTHAICAVFIPIFPLGAYRVQEAGDEGYFFLSKNKLSRFARLSQGAVLAGVVALIATLAISSYLGSPTRQARLAMHEASALVAAGKTAEAIDAYEDLTSKYGSEGGRDRMKEAGAALVPLYLSQVPTPVTLDNQEQARAILKRFSRLPKFVRGGAPTTAMSVEVVTWAKSLDGPNVEERLASLRMLEQAQTLLGSHNPEIAALREEQRLGLAAKIAEDRPVDGLDLYMEAGQAGWPGAGAILLSLNPSQLHSVKHLREQWLQYNPQTTSEEPNLATLIAAADAAMNSEEHKALLAEPTETTLAKAIEDGAIGQDLRVALAEIQLGEGRSQEALTLLQSIGKPGEMIRNGQLVLAQAYVDVGELEKADEVLTAYLSLRLPRFQGASTKFNERVNTMQEKTLAQAQNGMLPPQINNRLEAASDEDEQYRIFMEWSYERIEADPEVKALRVLYDEYSDVIPAVLQQGMVKLQRANMLQGAEREAILAEAERSFLAISADAAGLPSYHLNLGTVYYRLGKTEAGDAEFAELLSQGDPDIKLAVVNTYRALQLTARARDLATQIWEEEQDPYKEGAAGLLALLATDVDEKETWLLRTNQDNPANQIRLTDVQAQRAQLAGEDAKADALYAKVAAYYTNEASNSSSTLNNAAIANQNRYAVTGEISHLDKARVGLEQALAKEPSSPIITSNLVALRAHHGYLEVLHDWIRLEQVRPSQFDAATLIADLSRGPLRTKLVDAMTKNASLRRSRALGKQLQMLSPNAEQGWDSERSWGSVLRDEKSMATLLPRVQAVAFDTSETESNRKQFTSGALDERLVRETREHITRTERQLEKARKAGHGPTIAALASMQAVNYGRIEGIDLDQEAAQKAAMLLMEAHKAWPELGANYDLVGQLFTIALFRAAQGDEDLLSFCNREGRIYGMSPLIFEGEGYQDAKATLLAKLKVQPEFRQAIELAIELGSAQPRLRFWLLGQLDDNATLMKLNEPVFSEQHRVLDAAIRAAMDPSSLHAARRLALFEANAN